jgi:hypothetical protein
MKRLINLATVMGLLILAVGCSTQSTSTRQIEDIVLSPPPTWEGITPGFTTGQGATELLGRPSQVEERIGYQIYRYAPRRGWNYQLVEVWLEERNEELIVSAIFRTHPLNVELIMDADVGTLDELVVEYGRPHLVKWGSFCRVRYLFWPNQGILAEANASVSIFDWNELRLEQVLIFEPMSLDQVIDKPWPWPSDYIYMGWTDHNPCTREVTDAPDTLPEDPYNWENMPTQ